MSESKNESKSSRVRKPNKTDDEIISLLEKNGEPMRFHEISKALNYTSGKLQSAIKRLLKNEKIVKKKIPLSKEESKMSSGRTHVTVIYTEDFKSDVIIPVRMDETTAQIIEQVPEVDDAFDGLDDLIHTALINFFSKNISNQTKMKAIKAAVAKGLISKEKGDKLLGR